MPNRILREGILTSERIASLNWAEEVFYRRLMSVVDDFGRYYATNMLLRAACYPLHLNKVSDSDIEKWLTACVNAALVRVYPAKDGKRYLEVMDFRQQVRAKESKFPAPADDLRSACVADAAQMQANAHLDVFGDGDGDDLHAQPAPKARASLVDMFDEFWQAYPKKRAKDDAQKAFAKRKPDRALLDSMLMAIEAQRKTDDWTKENGQFIPYPATWLNDGRWHDEKTDVAQPVRQGPDPELERIKRDSLNAAPMPKEVREKFQELLKAKRIGVAQE